MSLILTRWPLADSSSATCRSGGWYFRARYLLHTHRRKPNATAGLMDGTCN